MKRFRITSISKDEKGIISGFFLPAVWMLTALLCSTGCKMYIFDGKCQKQILYSRKRKKYASDDDISSCFHSPFLSIFRLSHEYLTYHFFIKQTPHPAKSKSVEQRIRELTGFTHYSMGSIGVKSLSTWAPPSCTAECFIRRNWRVCRTFPYILTNERNEMNGGYAADHLTALLKSEMEMNERKQKNNIKKGQLLWSHIKRIQAAIKRCLLD